MDDALRPDEREHRVDRDGEAEVRPQERVDALALEGGVFEVGHRAVPDGDGLAGHSHRQAAVLLGVDGDDAAGTDDDMVDVPAVHPDGKPVEDRPLRRQLGEEGADGEFALRTAVPAEGVAAERGAAEEAGETGAVRVGTLLAEQFVDDGLCGEPAAHALVFDAAVVDTARIDRAFVDHVIAPPD